MMKLSRMASGNLGLDLTSDVGWDEFPIYIGKLLKKINGSVVSKHDAIDMRIWDIRVQDVDLRCVYDDYPQMVSIESSSKSGNEVIKNILENLQSD